MQSLATSLGAGQSVDISHLTSGKKAKKQNKWVLCVSFTVHVNQFYLFLWWFFHLQNNISYWNCFNWNVMRWALIVSFTVTVKTDLYKFPLPKYYKIDIDFDVTIFFYLSKRFHEILIETHPVFCTVCKLIFDRKQFKLIILFFGGSSCL